MKPVITIDLKHGYRSPDYIAFRIWQQLFNIFRHGGGDLNRMNNLTVDLIILEAAVQKAVQAKPQRLSLYWEWGTVGSTELNPIASSPACYHIEWESGADIITITPPEGII